MRISDWSSDVCASDLANCSRAIVVGGGAFSCCINATKNNPTASSADTIKITACRFKSRQAMSGDRKRVVKGESVTFCVDIVGSRIIQKQQKKRTREQKRIITESVSRKKLNNIT